MVGFNVWLGEKKVHVLLRIKVAFREHCWLGGVFFVSIAILTACAENSVDVVRPRPVTPGDVVVEKWDSQQGTASSELPSPLTAERAIEEALRASPELEQIRQRILAATEQVRQAESAFYPRFVVAEDFNITNNPVYALMNVINQKRFDTSINFNNPGTQQDFGTYLRGEMSLFEGGSHWYQRKAALSQRRSLGAELQTARNQLALKVTEVYYQWLQARCYIGVAEQALEAARVDEKLGEARLKAEAALPSELLRLKARRAEAQGNLVNAHSSASKLQAALERLLVRPIQPGEIPEPPVDAAAYLVAMPEKVEREYIEEALRKRPEMAAVQAMIEAAEARLKASQSGLLPRIGSNVWYGWNSETLRKLSDSWMLAVQATWPLFEGGVTAARIEEARSRLREVKARSEQVALDIALEVHQATLAVQEAAEKIRVAEERRLWAKKALDETRQIYAKQAATVDSLLQAEVSWNQAEVAYTAALYEGKIAQASLRSALGDFAQQLTAADNRQ